MTGYYRRFKYTVKLSCGCFDLDARKTGDKACTFHGWQTITGHYSKEWHARCVDCGRGNTWSGQSRDGADRAARNHTRAHPSHRVAVIYDSLEHPEKVARLRRSMYPEQDKLTEPVDYGPPPF